MTDAIVVTFYPEINAGGFSRRDGTVEFYSRVQALLRPEYVVLDFGAGRGACATSFALSEAFADLRRGRRVVAGVDIDSVVSTNPSIDDAVTIDPNAALPFAEDTFDVIVSNSTLEHVLDAERVASELGRVLQDPVGGSVRGRLIAMVMSHWRTA